MKFVARTWIRRCLTFMVGLFCLEGVMQLTHVTDFPVYEVDPSIGYIPAPNQHGNFLLLHDWIFNERSMGAESFIPDRKTDVLLLGDSIVYGGNALRQREKLGPQLAAFSLGKWDVWPAGAGSWAAQNEMVYLDRNSDVLSHIEKLVWVVNSGDFQEKTLWKSDLINPTSRPVSALKYAVHKYFWHGFLRPELNKRYPDRFPSLSIPSAGEPMQDVSLFQDYLKQLKATYPGLQILLVAYPTQYEMKTPGAMPWKEICSRLKAFASQNGIECLDLLEEGEWSWDLYRDFIHPSADGNRVLASLIGRRL